MYEHMGKDHPVPMEEVKKQKGLWHMEYTEENYRKVRQELNELKKQKDRLNEDEDSDILGMSGIDDQ